MGIKQLGKKFLWTLSLVALVISMAIPAIADDVPNPGTRLFMQAVKPDIMRSGDEFTVQVYLAGATDLAGIAFEVSYDPAVLQVVPDPEDHSVTVNSDVFKTVGDIENPFFRLDAEGKVRIDGTTYTAGYDAQQNSVLNPLTTGGEPVLTGTIKFKLLKEISTQLDFSFSELIDNGYPAPVTIPHDAVPLVIEPLNLSPDFILNFDAASYELNADDTRNTIVTAISNGVSYDVTADAVFSSDDTAIAEVDSNGVITAKSAGETVIRAEYLGKLAEAGVIVTEVEGCFIATAAYGSYLDPHVQVLRDFRDNTLLKHSWGKWLVALYYHNSPPLADFIARHEVLRLLVRIALTPVVFSIEYTGLFFLFLISIAIVPLVRRQYNRRQYSI